MPSCRCFNGPRDLLLCDRDYGLSGRARDGHACALSRYCGCSLPRVHVHAVLSDRVCVIHEDVCVISDCGCVLHGCFRGRGAHACGALHKHALLETVASSSNSRYWYAHVIHCILGYPKDSVFLSVHCQMVEEQQPA